MVLVKHFVVQEGVNDLLLVEVGLLETSSKVWRWDTLVSMIVRMGVNCLTNFLSTCSMLVYVNGVHKVTVYTEVKKAR